MTDETPKLPDFNPIIPAAYAKTVWIIFMILSILLAGWQSTAIILWGQDSKYAAVAAIWVGVIAAVIRFLTTNSFGAAKVLVGVIFLGSLVSLSACSETQKKAVSDYFKTVGECSLSAATEQGSALIKELDTATSKPGNIDWKAKGTALGFDVLACALEALANIVQNRLDLALAPEQMGLMPDPKVIALRDQLTRINIAKMDLAK